VALAARLAGLPLDEFQALNPQMNQPVILAAGTPQVLLPYDNAQRFIRALTEHRGPLATWTAWVVPKTMKPLEAAKRCGCGMAEDDLREVNRIPPRMLVKAGSTLLVPRNGHRHDQDVSERVADNATMMLAPDRPPLRRVTVKARKGDTLASLARRYSVSPASVADWNKLASAAKLRAGQVLVVYLPTKPKGSKAGAASKASTGKRAKAASTAAAPRKRAAAKSSAR